jgi:hypothetical protein
MASIKYSAISFTQGCVTFCQLGQKIKWGGTMAHKHATTHSQSVSLSLTQTYPARWRSQKFIFSILDGKLTKMKAWPLRGKSQYREIKTGII